MSCPPGELALPGTAPRARSLGPSSALLTPTELQLLGPHRATSIPGLVLPEQFSLKIFDAVPQRGEGLFSTWMLLRGAEKS